MADFAKRLGQNVDGEFFVDDSCIDCDTCRQIAPATFRDHGAHSSVYQQPRTADQWQRAAMALVSCPTASIGTRSHRTARAGVEAFPERLFDDVFFCGFTAEASFGAWAYLIVRPAERGGNVLVDSPRFAMPLVRRLEHMGGVRLMVLTHRDDVADHDRFASHFGCTRVMHARDGAARLGVEHVADGDAPVPLDDDLLAIPTPGHTRGHQVLLYREQALFTGDHLAWSPTRRRLVAFRDVCWYSWPEQIQSMAKLLRYRFSWVLPGHGRIHHAAPDEMRRHLEDCLARMSHAA